MGENDEIEFDMDSMSINIDKDYISVYMRFKKKLKIEDTEYTSIIFINDKESAGIYNIGLKNYWNNNIGDILRYKLEDNVSLLTMFADNSIVKDVSPIRILDIKSVDLRNKVIDECRYAIIEHRYLT